MLRVVAGGCVPSEPEAVVRVAFVVQGLCPRGDAPVAGGTPREVEPAASAGAVSNEVCRLRRDVRGPCAQPGALPGVSGGEATGAEALTGVARLARWCGRRYGRPHLDVPIYADVMGA